MTQKKSKSKTFQRGTDFGDVVDWLFKNVKTDEREVVTNTLPGYDVLCEVDSKYLITITKIEDRKEE